MSWDSDDNQPTTEEWLADLDRELDDYFRRKAMPMPTPRDKETHDDFMTRCHEEMHQEFPEQDQRNAVCERQWKDHMGKSTAERLKPFRNAE